MDDMLRNIEGCIDGVECPEAAQCRRVCPTVCPLLQDDDFNMDPDMPVDKMMR